MRKSLLVAAVLLAAPFAPAAAQLGIKLGGGATFSSINEAPPGFTENSDVGYYVGGSVRFGLGVRPLTGGPPRRLVHEHRPDGTVPGRWSRAPVRNAEQAAPHARRVLRGAVGLPRLVLARRSDRGSDPLDASPRDRRVASRPDEPGRGRRSRLPDRLAARLLDVHVSSQSGDEQLDGHPRQLEPAPPAVGVLPCPRRFSDSRRARRPRPVVDDAPAAGGAACTPIRQRATVLILRRRTHGILRFAQDDARGPADSGVVAADLRSASPTAVGLPSVVGPLRSG